jgi:SsrA-binding protein
MAQIKNKKAYFEYHISDEFVAGLQLVGSEIKSIRNNNVNISDGYCFIWDNEIFVKNIFISKYDESSYMNHEERRDRKLLLRKSEIRKIIKLTQDKGVTLIPLEMFPVRGRFKLKIGVAKGKKLYDKRNTIKERDVKRDLSKSES